MGVRVRAYLRNGKRVSGYMRSGSGRHNFKRFQTIPGSTRFSTLSPLRAKKKISRGGARSGNVRAGSVIKPRYRSNEKASIIKGRKTARGGTTKTRSITRRKRKRSGLGRDSRGQRSRS